MMHICNHLTLFLLSKKIKYKRQPFLLNVDDNPPTHRYSFIYAVALEALQ